LDAIEPQTLPAVGEGKTARAESPEVTALVERAKTGDASAFDDLMRLYERRIISIGVQMGLSTDDAMDACQDAFIKVFRYIGRFHSGESFYKWLYRIAVHAIYDHLRRIRRPGVVSLDDAEIARIASARDDRTSPGGRVENADLVAKLVAGLDVLTRQERIVFVLRDLQEVDTLEIGRILRLSQVTVRRHCGAARQKLRERLFPPKT